MVALEIHWNMSTPKVCITGIGAISPNGLGREAFWQATREGCSGVRKISRFDCSGQPVQIAGEVIGFNPLNYMNIRDLEGTGLATPFALAAVGEALEEARVDWKRMSIDQLRGVSVYVGSGGGNQEFTERQYSLYYSGQQKKCSVYVIPSSTLGTLASEISMQYGFRGLSHMFSNGCTSSTDAIGYAYRAVKHGEAEMVICGGVDAPIAPLTLRGFQLLRIMSTGSNESPGSASKPFSKHRDGFVLAEGAWFFVMETEEGARRRGAPIYGEIQGYGATCEAFHRVRLEEVGIEPARAMQLAMEEAGAAPADFDYLHYHGTATQLNDRVETTAVKLAFGEHAYRMPGSSVKSVIGHPQGACGAASLATTLLAIRDGYAPPTINLEEAADECDLDYVAQVGRKLEIKKAMVNTIAFGSKNAALVVGSL
ncbi:MAG: beta-ketoacyl-[acyl-carrier-protein] synthase family protein [Bryobacter sp.]|jgi:3-oxoacyl-[acyl-carrier-protein] synthase II|nr:beta-ketoacyl-[acyl-carrier-protein] synthase family protein [Bryobacter sp. CoA8 C33]